MQGQNHSVSWKMPSVVCQGVWSAKENCLHGGQRGVQPEIRCKVQVLFLVWSMKQRNEILKMEMPSVSAHLTLMVFQIMKKTFLVWPKMSCTLLCFPAPNKGKKESPNKQKSKRFCVSLVPLFITLIKTSSPGSVVLQADLGQPEILLLQSSLILYFRSYKYSSRQSKGGKKPTGKSLPSKREFVVFFILPLMFLQKQKG